MFSRMIALAVGIAVLTACAGDIPEMAPTPPIMYYDVDFQSVFATNPSVANRLPLFERHSGQNQA